VNGDAARTANTMAKKLCRHRRTRPTPANEQPACLRDSPLFFLAFQAVGASARSSSPQIFVGVDPITDVFVAIVSGFRASGPRLQARKRQFLEQAQQKAFSVDDHRHHNQNLDDDRGHLPDPLRRSVVPSRSRWMKA
jgi:hypothetical protein